MLGGRLNLVTDQVRRHQLKFMLLLIAALTILVVAMAVMLFSQKSSRPQVLTSASYKTPIANAGSLINPQELWVERLTAAHDGTAKRIADLEKMVETLVATGVAATPEVKSSTPGAPSDLAISSAPSLTSSPELGDSSQDPIGEMRADLSQVHQQRQAGHQSSHQGDQDPRNQDPGGQPFMPISGTGFGPTFPPVPTSLARSSKTRPHTKGIARVSLNLMNSKAHKSLKTHDNTIPAGAFAQAVLLGGVDASTSIQAASDPRPILLRITDEGTLPRRFRSDLCGCHVLAASYGDISSERVFMRLEKLTCTERATGEIVEMTVGGYVAGEDGRAGLRGVVVDRAGEHVRNAAIGGFLSGMGSFFSQPTTPTTYSLNSGLAQTNPLTNGDLLRQGVSKGAGGALEKYADFYIKRAEQMQPVLQVQAGRVVDIVFTQSAAFEDSAAGAARVHHNDQSRFATIQAHEAPAPAIGAWATAQGDTQ